MARSIFVYVPDRRSTEYNALKKVIDTVFSGKDIVLAQDLEELRARNYDVMISLGDERQFREVRERVEAMKLTRMPCIGYYRGPNIIRHLATTLQFMGERAC
jgi:hypothetical protein